MKLIKYLVVCLSLCASAFASNQHTHPQAQADTRGAKWAVGCGVEIINQSYMDVQVFGVFDDGSSLYPFNIYRFSPPHSIFLDYNGYCHSGIELDIDTFMGYHVFGGYVPRGSTVFILPGIMNQVKATIRN